MFRTISVLIEQVYNTTTWLMQAFAKKKTKTKESTIQRYIFSSLNTIHFFKAFISKIQQKHKGNQDSRNLKTRRLGWGGTY